MRIARTAMLAAALLGTAPPLAAQGLPAGERARGVGRCPLGTVAEAMPGGYRCARPNEAPPQQAQAGAAGGQAREVSRGAVAPWLPFAAGALVVLGVGIALSANQGGSSSAPTGTQP
jgi:hypothetical protein